MKNKKIIIIFFVSILVTNFALFVLVYINDPLQLFHIHSNKKGLVLNARHQVAGIINNYTFDSIILGTSHLENTSAAESSKILGGEFVNISLSGSDFHTRSIVLNYVLKNKKIKIVIFSLDHNGLVNAHMGNTSDFDFLYDDNILNDIKVYINPKYIFCSFINAICLHHLDPDRPYAWYKRTRHIKRFGGINNWFKAKNDMKIRNAFKQILKTVQKIKLGKTNIEENYDINLKVSQQYIDDKLILYVSRYPDTEFIFILPPYSKIKFSLDAQYNVSAFKRYKKNIKYLVNQSTKYSNLKIYGWGNHSFVADIKNYKDLTHYEYKINSWMLRAIKRKEGLLTTKNIDRYLKIFTQQSLDYNLVEIGNKIETYLNSQ